MPVWLLWGCGTCCCCGAVAVTAVGLCLCGCCGLWGYQSHAKVQLKSPQSQAKACQSHAKVNQKGCPAKLPKPYKNICILQLFQHRVNFPLFPYFPLFPSGTFSLSGEANLEMPLLIGFQSAKASEYFVGVLGQQILRCLC